MSVTLPSGLTAQQVIDGLGEIATLGLSALGDAEIAALVPLVTRLAGDAADLIAGKSEALTTEVDAEQAAGGVAEDEKFGHVP